MYTVVCPVLSSTQQLPKIYWMLTGYQMEREQRTSPHESSMRALSSALKHRGMWLYCVIVSQDYLVHKAFSAHCRFWQMWGRVSWGSSLEKMDSDVAHSSPKTVQGDIPLNDSLLNFRNSLSFLFTNYTDLSGGKDWHCEYITCFKNHVCKWNGVVVPREVCRRDHMRTPPIWKILPHLSHLRILKQLPQPLPNLGTFFRNKYYSV